MENKTDKISLVKVRGLCLLLILHSQIDSQHENGLNLETEVKIVKVSCCGGQGRG